MPTFVERAVWGCGDGSDLLSYETDSGRIGGLICGEHLMPLIRARMIEQGEDFHIAVFPGAFSLHCGPKLEEADTEGRFFCSGAPAGANPGSRPRNWIGAFLNPGASPSPYNSDNLGEFPIALGAPW